MKSKTLLTLSAAFLMGFTIAWSMGYASGLLRGRAESRREFAADVWIENVSGDDANTVLFCTAELAGANPKSIIPPGTRVRLDAYWPEK